MPSRRAAPRAEVAVLAVGVATGVLLALAAVFTVQAPGTAAAVNLVLGLLVGVPAVALGLVIVRRRDAAGVGVLLACLALATALTVARETWLLVLPGWGDPAAWEWLRLALAEAATWVLALVGLLLLHFPTGRVPGPGWRWVPPALVGCAAVTHAAGALEQQPGWAPLWLDVAVVVVFLALLALVLLCAASLVVRYRRGDGTDRARIRWLALAGTAVALYPFTCLLEIALVGQPWWGSALLGATALVGIPVTTGVAVLRHDLYDVDKALAAALTWALLTGVLVAVYAVASLATGTLLGRGSEVSAATGAVLCALALVPLRRRLQALVDSRLYPLRRGAMAALESLDARVGAGSARPEELEAVLREALRDPGLRVGYRVPGTDLLVDADQRPVPTPAADTPAPGGPLAVPVRSGDVTTGLLVAGQGVASVELLREVAARAATLVQVVRLRLELSGALREVEASRGRLVQTGYQERRRLERDLHDGAQQRLVSLGLTLRLAQRHLDDACGTTLTREGLDALIDSSVAELGLAVAELRQVAHGLRPSSLDDGLEAAVARMVRSVPLPVALDVRPGALPDHVATTAYYVLSEAVTNAVKHAEATQLQVCVRRYGPAGVRGGRLLVRVRDDGRGGARLSRASTIGDRVAALGGSLSVVSPAGGGTTVEAVLPCAS